MISIEKVSNCKVVQHFEIYNFCFGCFSIRGRLKISNFKFEKSNVIFVR
jgi:hypothetical protein